MTSQPSAASSVIPKVEGHTEMQSFQCSDCGDLFTDVKEEE